MIKKIFILALFCLTVSISTYAQEGKIYTTIDLVYTTNGTFKGQILEYIQGEFLIIQEENGNQATILEEDIKKIVQKKLRRPVTIGEDGYTELPRLAIEGKREGFYNKTYINFLSGAMNDGGLSLGTGIHTQFGKQFSDLVGVGIGFGVDSYRPGSGQTLLPVFVEYNVFPVKNNKDLFASLGAGYGFALKNSSLGIFEAKGGFMLNPSVGFRINTSERSSTTFGFGMKMQDAFFREESFRTGNDIVNYDLFYKRFDIRIGVMIW